MWLFRSAFVLLAFVAITICTGIRTFKLIKYFLPSTKVFIFWPIYLLFSYSYILSMFLRFAWLRYIRPAAMYTLPFLLYFFFILLVLDLVRLILRILKINPPSPQMAGRTFPPNITAAALALLFAFISMIYGGFHARNIQTAHYSLTINKSGFQTPLRIALVSDSHIGQSVKRKWVANIVNAVNRTQPDIICIAGDIFDSDPGGVEDLDGIAAELRRLKAPLGVYACLGNHDRNRNRIDDFLNEAGIVLLADQAELIADRFYIVGRRDASIRNFRPASQNQAPNSEAANQITPLARMSAAELTADLDKSKPVIFLDHQPVDFKAEEEAGADLIFSGHTHAGQIFPATLVTERIYKQAGAVNYGYWRGKSAQAIVSSGAGLWGPALRIGTNSEVAAIDIK